MSKGALSYKSLSSLSSTALPRSSSSVALFYGQTRSIASSSSSRASTSPSSPGAAGPSTFAIQTPRATPGRRNPRPKSSTQTYEPRPRDGAGLNYHLYRLRVALTEADLQTAWQARAALVEGGHAKVIPDSLNRDLRRLIRRVREGAAPRPDQLDIDACSQELISHHIRRALDTDRSPELVNWVSDLIFIGQADRAVHVAFDYLEQANLQNRVMNKAAQRLSSGTQDSQEPSTTEQEADPELSSLLEVRSYERLLPRFLGDFLILTIHALVLTTGDAQRLYPIMRQLPMPDRTSLCLFESHRIAKLLPSRTDGNDENINMSRRCIGEAEMLWGLNRPEIEVGRNPLASLFGSLVAKSHSKAASELLDILLHSTEPSKRLLWWIEGLPRPSELPAAAAQPDVTTATWATILRGCITTGDRAAASRVWSHIQSLGLEQTPRLYLALLTGYASTGQWAALESTWNQLRETSSPDVHCYVTIISGLFKARKADEALEIFYQFAAMAETGKIPEADDAEQRTVLYNAVLAGLLRNSRDEMAQALLQSMVSSASSIRSSMNKAASSASGPLTKKAASSAPPANTTTLNILLRGHSRRGDLVAVTNALEASAQWDIRPDMVTYVTVLDALIRHGAANSQQRAVDAIRSMMLSNGMRLNTVAWSAMIKGVLQVSDAEDDSGDDTEGSYDALDEGHAADDATVSTKIGQLRAGLHMLAAMKEDGIAPNEVTFTCLIQAACQLDRMTESDVNAMSQAAAGTMDLPIEPLRPMRALSETQQQVDVLRSSKPGTAIALALSQAMTSKDRVQPNRKMYHVFLANLLRGWTPSTLSSSAGNSRWEASQIAFARGLVLLDAFCEPVFKASPKLTRLVSPSADRSDHLHSRTAPSDISWRIVLEALLNRMAAIDNGPLDTSSQSAQAKDSNETLRPLSPLAARQLTLTVLNEVLERIKVFNAMRQDGSGSTPGDGLSASLRRLRTRAETLLSHNRS